MRRETTLPGADDDWIKGAQGSELRFPRFVTIRGFADRTGEDALFGDDDEQRQVNGVNALEENSALPAPLTLRFKERDRVLEVIRVNGATARLNRLERHAVARIHIRHLAFSDDDERLLMNAVLPRIQSEVNTAAQEPGLEAGFAVARNDLAFMARALAAPDFVDDADLRVRNVNDSEQTRQADQQDYDSQTAQPQNPWGFRK